MIFQKRQPAKFFIVVVDVVVVVVLLLFKPQIITIHILINSFRFPFWVSECVCVWVCVTQFPLILWQCSCLISVNNQSHSLSESMTRMGGGRCDEVQPANQPTSQPPETTFASSSSDFFFFNYYLFCCFYLTLKPPNAHFYAQLFCLPSQATPSTTSRSTKKDFKMIRVIFEKGLFNGGSTHQHRG